MWKSEFGNCWRGRWEYRFYGLGEEDALSKDYQYPATSLLHGPHPMFVRMFDGVVSCRRTLCSCVQDLALHVTAL